MTVGSVNDGAWFGGMPFLFPALLLCLPSHAHTYLYTSWTPAQALLATALLPY